MFQVLATLYWEISFRCYKPHSPEVLILIQNEDMASYTLNLIDLFVKQFLFIMGVITFTKAAHMRFNNTFHLRKKQHVRPFRITLAPRQRRLMSSCTYRFRVINFCKITNSSKNPPSGMKKNILLQMQTLLSKTHSHKLFSECSFTQLIQKQTQIIHSYPDFFCCYYYECNKQAISNKSHHH